MKIYSIIYNPKHFDFTKAKPGSGLSAYVQYSSLYKYLNEVLEHSNTVELGNMHKGLLGMLSKKIYAMKYNRDVRDNDPTDLSIWVEYKIKQIKKWLHQSKSIALDRISKYMNKRGNYVISSDTGTEYNINTSRLNYINFCLILRKVFPSMNFSINVKISNYPNLMSEETIMIFSNKIKKMIEKYKKDGIELDEDKIIPKLISSWIKYTDRKE